MFVPCRAGNRSVKKTTSPMSTFICPVRALRFYIDRSSSFRQSIQLLGAMEGVRRAEPYRKQSLSHWIVDTTTEAYTTQGLENALCTLGAVQRGLSFHLSVVKMYVYSRYLQEILLGAITLYSSYNTAIAGCVLPWSQHSPCSHLPDMQILYT